MDEAWKAWMRTAIANRTWAAWKTHWTAAFQEKRELIKLTGTAFNEMANQAEEAQMGDKMVSALDNLANAQPSNATTPSSNWLNPTRLSPKRSSPSRPKSKEFSQSSLLSLPENQPNHPKQAVKGVATGIRKGTVSGMALK
ncbi:hypothetical protein ACHAXR_000338 [Thalassiosira sp. AJA248-18]